MAPITPPANFSGLASGLDTTSIIDRLMQIERLPEQGLDSHVTRLQSQKATWLDVNSGLLSLKTAADALQDIGLWNSKIANVTDQTNLAATAGTTATTGTYSMTVTQLARAESDSSKSFAAETTALGLTGTFSLTAGGTTASITVAATDTLDNVRDKINQAGAGATASVVSTAPGSFALLLQSNQTGTANAITFTDDPVNKTLQNLGVLTATGAKNVVQTALDAQFTVNGLAFTRSSNTVTDAISGVTLNLKGTNTTGLTLSVQADTATITSRIQDFVSRFNAARGSLRKLSGKGQLLQGDPTLLSTMNQMANMAYSAVPGLTGLKSLSAIGISLQRDGTLAVDSGKLANALSSNLAGVKALLTTPSTGVATRFSAYLGKLTGPTGIINSLSRSFDRQVQDLQNQRQAMERALALKQQHLRDQFTNMEKLVSTFKSQGDWLAAQLGNLSGGGGSGVPTGKP